MRKSCAVLGVEVKGEREEALVLSAPRGAPDNSKGLSWHRDERSPGTPPGQDAVEGAAGCSPHP
jgi:hypothetical protein